MGGITSASREAMRPVVNAIGALYFYNEQYEGGVCDKNVFCTGVTPAQQLGDLVPWSIQEYGSKFYTLAADYNYGHISADWVKVFLKESEGSELLGEEFIPLDVVDFGSVIQRIEQRAAECGDVLAGRRQPHRLLPPVSRRQVCTQEDPDRFPHLWTGQRADRAPARGG